MAVKKVNSTRSNHYRRKDQFPLFSQFTAEEIHQAIMPYDPLASPLEELIATTEAVFTFIRYSDMDMTMRNAFGQLERQFEFYKRLVEMDDKSNVA